MEKIGFTRGEASPCIFAHESRGIDCSVHGDDFTSTGPKAELDWLEAQFKSNMNGVRADALDQEPPMRRSSPCSTECFGMLLMASNTKLSRGKGIRC